MAHNILGQRFYNKRTQPAWHGLGINDENPHSAEEALRRIGLYDVRKFPLEVKLPDGKHKTGLYQLWREPIAEDPQWVAFGGAVTSDYEVVTPLKAAQTWDKNVRGLEGEAVAIETLGILGRGEHLFICTELPKIDVRGDEVAMYLLFNSPLTPGSSVGVFTTGVRTVCQNTLNAGIARAVERRTLTHNTGVLKTMGKWLKGIYQNALEARALLNEAYNVLADKRVTDAQVKWIADTLYPLPKRPVESARARLPMNERMKFFEMGVAYTERLRRTVYNLYDGMGVGMDTKAVKGTAFGAFNAVAELETYRRGDSMKAAQGLIDGERARRIRGGLTLAMNVDQWETLDVTKLGFHSPLDEEELAALN